MTSPDVAYFALERWKDSKASLRLYSLFSDRAFFHDLAVEKVDAESGEVVVLIDEFERKVFNLSTATFKYTDSDRNLPDEVTCLFAGYFLEINMPGGELFVLGELFN